MNVVEPASSETVAGGLRGLLDGRGAAEPPDALYLACLAVLVLATYAPVYTQSYLATDDYGMTEGPPADYFLACGRPLQGLAYHLFPRAPATLDGFRPFRLLATLGVVGLTMMLWYRLARLIPARFPRLLAVAAIAALPPLQVVVAWTCCWPFAIGALLAGFSACLVLGAGQAARQPLRNAPCFATAAVLHVAALCIYQPAGMWFWTIVLIDALTVGLWEPKQFRRMTVALACGLLHIGLYYALIRGWQLAAHVEMLQRGAATTEPLAKLSWFVNKPLVCSLGGWNLYRPYWFVFAAVPLILAASWIAVRELYVNLRQRGYTAATAIGQIATQTCWILGLIPLAYLPNLAVAESASSCRSELALGPSLAVLLIWAAGVLVTRCELSTQAWRVAQSVAVLGCLAALYAARSNIVETIILPQQREYRFVLESLDRHSPPTVAGLHMVCPSDLKLSPRQRHDEFGIPSSTTSWGAAGMLRIALRERGWPEPPPTTFSQQPIGSQDKSVLVVDLRRLQLK